MPPRSRLGGDWPSSDAGASRSRRAPPTTSDGAGLSRAEESSVCENNSSKNIHPKVCHPDSVFLEIVRTCSPFGVRYITEEGVVAELKVATLCSGTEAPIYALRGIQRAGRALGVGEIIKFKHVMSCEIEAWKQAYIRRNLSVPLIFRDVRELGILKADKAMVADGHYEEIPTDIDLLVFGSSCVDYSNLNTTKNSEKKMAGPVKRDNSVSQNAKTSIAADTGTTGPSAEEALEPNTEHEDPTDPFPAFFDEFPKKLGTGRAYSYTHVPLGQADSKFMECLSLALEMNDERLGGESATTFFGSLCYAFKVRPACIYMENVEGAPYDVYQKFWLPKAGFVAKYVKVDSKEFLMPQTRMRGYVFAVDYHRFQEASEMLVDGWMSAMRRSKHKGNMVPLDALLLDSHDERIKRAKAQMEDKPVRARQDIKWESARTRHETVRRTEGLSNDKQFSMLEDVRGLLINVQPNCRSWISWLKNQPVRVLDHLEISYARGLKVGCDIRYKATVLDLSQNIDRTPPINEESLGTVGCITPDGIPFLSGQQRPITGIEALALQGLPIDELILSTESQADLQDLAGNAMTVPCIATALLLGVASIVVSKHPRAFTLEPGSARPETSHVHIMPKVNYSKAAHPANLDGVVEQFDMVSIPWGSDSWKGDIGRILNLHRLGRRYCFCHTKGVLNVRRCGACEDTACEACWGNPSHVQGPTELLTIEPISPEKVKSDLMKDFPGRICIAVTDVPSLDSFGFLHYKGHVDGGLNNTTTLWNQIVRILRYQVCYLQDVKITEAITVRYKSKRTVVQAVIDRGTLTWYIFISREYAGLETLGPDFDISQPIARYQWATKSWELWVPRPMNVGLSIEDQNDAQAVKVSCDEGSSLPPELPGQILNEIQDRLAAVQGIYSSRENCVGAEKSLYVRLETRDNPTRLYLFKDVRQIGPFNKDGIVIAKTCRQLDNYEYREVEVHFPPGSQPHNRRFEETRGYIKGYWAAIASSSIYWGPVRPGGDARYDHVWFASKSQFGQSAAQTQCDMSHAPVLMSGAVPLLDFPVDPAIMAGWTAGQSDAASWFRIPPWQLPTFVKRFAFVFSKVFADTSGDKRISHLEGQKSIRYSGESCPRCITAPPASRWLEIEDKRGSRRYELFEDPNDTKRFEEFLKNLPEPLTAEVRMVRLNKSAPSPESSIVVIPGQDTGGAFPRTFSVDGQHDSLLLFQLRVNVHSLAHRAQMALAYPAKLRRRETLSTMRLFYQVESDYQPKHSYTFRDFHESLKPTDRAASEPSEREFVQDGLCLGESLVHVSQWKSFWNVKFPSMDIMNCQLYNDQMSAVLWMLGREAAPRPFKEQEIEECTIPGLGLRLIGKATYENRGFGSCGSSRGGILAHDVGYGKTVVTLGLLDAKRKSNDHEAKFPPQPLDGSENLSHRHIALSGTLIVVPATIIDQWRSEITNKLGTGWNVLIFRDFKDFDKATRSALQQAEILLCSLQLFTNDREDGRGKGYSSRLRNAGYIKRLADLSGLKFPPKLTGRAYYDWYRMACDRLEDVADEYDTLNRRGAPSHLIAERMAGFIASKKQEYHSQQQNLHQQRIAPSWRGSKLHVDGHTDATSSCASDKDIDKVIYALPSNHVLEMYSFGRIILDECSYENDQVNEFLANAVAPFK